MAIHRLLEQLARDILEQLGADATTVPVWDGNDFDSIYVINIEQDGNGNLSAAFHTERQGLNGLATACPGQAN